jgi:hypothetical protein
MAPPLPDDLLQGLANEALKRFTSELGRMCTKPRVTLAVPDREGDGAGTFIVTAMVEDADTGDQRSYEIKVTASPIH